MSSASSAGESQQVKEWGSSGLAHLTGLPDGPADFSRANVLARAHQVATAIGDRLGIDVDAVSLLAGRAALLGLTRGGRVSPGGGTRLFPARDGFCALTLSRADDLDAVPALLQVNDVSADPWPVLQRWAATRPVPEIVERAGLLDLPVAGLGEAPPAAPRIRLAGSRSAPRVPRGLLVADLSSMWAGPLCGHLLARAGATVVKVESPRRPDGTRIGNRAFFDWINGQKLCYEVDFDSQADELRELLAVSDVVIEGSRPAALARRGLAPGDVTPRAGRIWLQITGYDGHRPGFGDDTAVAGGLVGTSADGPVFCGDAIADPLAGLQAALAVAESVGRGGGELIGVSMAGVAATYAALPVEASASPAPVSAPSAPPASRQASWPGADNAAVRYLVSQRHVPSC
ncbi:CoA transferase [Mycobacterium sp. 1165178.9]|uniref:CoA transferase n=1 Tax=Mycobacterium sp. 1165178.9 TaxID=1834070 RepID=UPI000800A905|nr:CoA transferase [Mycobacterium sp. 1165178.9]OBK86587.1 acyl-CoA transferase [Mycobacterium sp. 1165178.9]